MLRHFVPARLLGRIVDMLTFAINFKKNESKRYEGIKRSGKSAGKGQ